MFNFSFSSLPQTDLFFLSLAIFCIILPPFLIFFYVILLDKLVFLWYFLKIKKIVYCPSVFFCENLKKELFKKPIKLEANPGNFLTLRDGLKKVMQIVVQEISQDKLPQELKLKDAGLFLFEKKILNKNGLRKINFINWLNKKIVSGNHISEKVLKMSIDVIWRMHEEFNQLISRKKNNL